MMASESCALCARHAAMLAVSAALLVPAVARGEPTPAPAPADVGQLDVTSDKPGKVYVDSEPKGPTPLHLERVSPGVHKVRIEYDDGSDEEKTAYVTEGMPARTRFEALAVMSGAAAFRHRHGFHIGVSAGFTAPGLLGEDDTMIAGGTASFLANVGITEDVDLRAALRLTVGPGSTTAFQVESYTTQSTVNALVEVPIAARFNIGSIYTMVAGFTVGARILHVNGAPVTLCSTSGQPYDGFCQGPTYTGTSPGTTKPFFVFGPEWSVASFRFGSHRQFEIEFLQGLLFNAANLDDRPAYRQSFTFSYLFL